jgi:hypothetical protein
MGKVNYFSLLSMPIANRGGRGLGVMILIARRTHQYGNDLSKIILSLLPLLL